MDLNINRKFAIILDFSPVSWGKQTMRHLKMIFCLGRHIIIACARFPADEHL